LSFKVIYKINLPTMEMTKSLNPNDILDESIPFDQKKVALLDDIV